MTRSEIALAVYNAVETRNHAGARALLADNFVFDGAVPQPIPADAWLGVHNALSDAFADFKFNTSNIREVDGKVLMNVALSGTHTGTLNVPMPGVPAIPASGKKFQNPVENVTLEFAGDKVTRLHVEHVENGGLAGIVKQVS